LKVYEAMGIVPREELESLIAGLDQETRRTLRGKKIRLGPVLVFQPDLNKPAAVRLRAVLWSLFNDKKLPADVPKDGVVSFKIDPQADRAFQQAVGYPVYGPRAIRIDMLDRVINAVYEGAQSGKFQAKHEMAEWLGCNIEDLYAVLSAMGHKKIYDPALNESAEEKPVEEKVVEEKPAEEVAAAPKVQVKPELATFLLKKGKAFEKPPRENKEDRPPRESFKQGRAGKKPARDGKRGEKRGERPERIISAAAKVNPEDSPFAILQQLKVKKDAG
jgi:ATP-dependent RNA helicase SUPV3L1/SUV3